MLFLKKIRPASYFLRVTYRYQIDCRFNTMSDLYGVNSIATSSSALALKICLIALCSSPCSILPALPISRRTNLFLGVNMTTCNSRARSSRLKVLRGSQVKVDWSSLRCCVARKDRESSKIFHGINLKVLYSAAFRGSLVNVVMYRALKCGGIW